jgi:hypothetical protein
MRLRSFWKTTFVSDCQYESHSHHASALASEILGEALPDSVSWLLPATAPATLEEESESDCESEADITGDLLAETLEDGENQDEPPRIVMSWQVPVCRFINIKGSLD